MAGAIVIDRSKDFAISFRVLRSFEYRGVEILLRRASLERARAAAIVDADEHWSRRHLKRLWLSSVDSPTGW